MAKKKKIDKYANDSIWQTAKSQFIKQNENLLTERNRQLQQNTLNQNQGLKSLTQNTETDKTGILGNAAGRGMAFSSGYTDDLKKYMLNQQNQIDTLKRQYSQQGSDVNAAYRQGRSLVSQQRQQALTDAIMRRTGGIL